jgi:hypothetical protein
MRIEGGSFHLPSLSEAPGTPRGAVGEVLNVSSHSILVITGDLYSSIQLTCESLEEEPTLGDEWEYFSEVSVVALEQPVALPEDDWDDPKGKGPLANDPAVDTWRLRVSAKGRRAAYEETNKRGQRFLIQTWPAPASPPTAPRATSKLSRIMNQIHSRQSRPGEHRRGSSSRLFDIM